MNITLALDIILSLDNKTEETEEIKKKLFDKKLKYGGRIKIKKELEERINELKSDN